MKTPLRILIAEDAEDAAALLMRKLATEGPYEPACKRVATLAAFNHALDGRAWDIIISDHGMPDFSAIDILRALRARDLDIPVIIVSGAIEAETAVAAMKAGAGDYIMKSDLTRLIPAIEREIREAKSRQEKRQTEEQLRQSQKMECVGRLSGGIAHDFNNLLAAILGSVSFLAVGPKGNPDWQTDVEEIRKAALRAASLTQQLLAFSRRQALQPRIFDLNSEIVDLERMLRRIVGEDVKWATSLTPKPCAIKADSGQVQQVIVNLIINARDAMSDGGKLNVKTESVEFAEPHVEGDVSIPPGAYVLLAISDTGTGVDDHAKAHLFEPFFTTKQMGKGTGLGLAVVYGIVKQSGGYIIVDSAPGQGTTFMIYFPKSEGPLSPRHIEPAARKSLKGTETILIVDDDTAVRNMLRRVLLQYGYTLLESDRGEETLKLVQAHQGNLHLLLTDVVLPDINGIELSRRIISIRSSIKILLISGYLERDFGNYDLDENVPFLHKPFTPEVLAHVVRETLNGHGSQDRQDSRLMTGNCSPPPRVSGGKVPLRDAG